MTRSGPGLVVGVLGDSSLPPSNFVHRSSWNWSSANFSCVVFSEARTAAVQHLWASLAEIGLLRVLSDLPDSRPRGSSAGWPLPSGTDYSRRSEQPRPWWRFWRHTVFGYPNTRVRK